MQTIETPDDIIENLDKAKEIVEDILKHLDRDDWNQDNLYDCLDKSKGDIEEAESIISACKITLKFVKPEPKPAPLGFCEYRGCVKGKEGCFCLGDEQMPCKTNPDTPTCYQFPTKEVKAFNLKSRNFTEKLDDLLKDLEKSGAFSFPFPSVKNYIIGKLNEMKAIILKK